MIPNCIIASPKAIAWLGEYFKNPKINENTLNLPTGTSFDLVESRYAAVYKDGRHEGLVFLNGSLVAKITFPVEVSLEKVAL